MENALKYTLILLTFAFVFISCDDDEQPDDNPQTTTCIDFVDLDTYYDKIIYLNFIDDTNGWVIGYSSSDPSKRILLNTADGGITWALIDADFQMDFDGSQFNGEALNFVSETKGFKNAEFDVETKLTIEYTTDKGVTWQTYSNPFVLNNPLGDEYLIPNWSGVSVSNGTETLFLGDYNANRCLLKINNNTMAISDYEIFVGSNMDLEINNESLHYAVDGTIVAVTDAGIVRSTNDANDWITVQSGIDGGFHSASWINDSIGFMVFGPDWSGGETMYKTTDGGLTWSSYVMAEEGSAYDRKLTMIRFVDENEGIAVSAFDFFVTHDGGHVWINQMCYTADGQYNAGFDEVLSYPSLNNGWIAGSSYNSSPSATGVFHYQGD